MDHAARDLERVLDGTRTLGTGEVAADVQAVLAAHGGVLGAVQDAVPGIAAAVELVVTALSSGGRLVYLGAGTSGWLAALDAAESIVTFGVRSRVDYTVGGGRLLDPTAMTTGDDDADGARTDPLLVALTPGDVALAVSASGRTPFTVAGAQTARARGAQVVAVTAAPGSPLGALAGVEVCVPVAGEIVGGSTRLTAGLAHKLVLNTVSTVAMVRLGRTVAGQMVCVEPLNDKLRARAVAAIATATGADAERVRAVLAEADGAGDVATVALLASVDVAAARARLDASAGHIPRATVDAP